jgi:hypothetical protein
MTYRAKATYPHIAQDRAVLGLRARLQELAAADGATPDWSTLRVVGPGEVVGTRGMVSYEWTATVEVQQEFARYV